MQFRQLNSKICSALLIGATLLCSTNLSAAIYKTVTADGKTVYTDTPDTSAKASVEMSTNKLSVVSTPGSRDNTSAERSASSVSSDPGANQKAKQINYSVQIISPADGSTVFKAQQTLQIQANIEPVPVAGARPEILLDGKVVGSGSASVDLMPLPRGQHTVSARVISSSGQLLSEDTVTFYLYQPSRLF